MVSVKNDFDKKVEEIEAFFKLLALISERNAKLTAADRAGRQRLIPLDEDLVRVLKANSFLLLYNLMESTVRLTLTYLYDEVTRSNTKYKDVIEEVRRVWIKLNYKNFKEKSAEDIYRVMTEIGEDLIAISFAADKSVSGNVNHVLITEHAERLGFSKSVHSSAHDGRALDLVKRKRNALAHGNMSFAECGREYTYSDLLETKKKTVTYLRSFMTNVERYISRRHFQV